MLSLILILAGYLLGAIPSGVVVGRAYGVDVRSVGSGNIGTANVLRAAGKQAAAFTMFGDMLKGLVPVLLARLLTDNEWVLAAVALAAVVGHCWPVFLGFKGGKGVATGAGTALALAPLVGLLMFALWWAVAFFTKYTSLSALVVMGVSPFIFLLFGQPWPYVLYAVLGGAAVIWRHRTNVQALLAGTERKVGEKKSERVK
ncbi:MAG: glycerol-3-phosphate 1-O-acyltransferase PlsY [Rubrobacter sp.]